VTRPGSPATGANEARGARGRPAGHPGAGLTLCEKGEGLPLCGALARQRGPGGGDAEGHLPGGVSQKTKHIALS